MSLYIFNFTEDYAIASADSRVCVSVDNGKTHYRWHDNMQKIHVVGNKIITVGGVEWAGSLVIKMFKESPNKSIERLKDLAKYITQNAEQIARSMGTKFVSLEEKIYFMEICVMTYEDGKNVAYHIADYKNFEIERVESRHGKLINFFGGIHIDDAKLVYRQFARNMDLVDVYKSMYAAVADEKCGGTLTLLEMKHGEIIKRHNYPIRDSREIKNIPDNIKAKYGINIIGQEGGFESLTIYDGEISNNELQRDPSLYSDLVIAKIGRYINDDGDNVRGIKLANGCFEITSRNVIGVPNNGIIMNPIDGLIVTKSDNKIRSKFNATEGISIESSTNGTDWLKKFFVDTSGKLNLVDIIASGEIVANSLAATTKLTVGNINVSDLITNGLNDDIYANLIEGKSIKAGTLSADKIVAGSLIVGTNVQMGSGSVINWNSVTPPTASQVGALPAGWTPDLSNYVTTGALSTSLSNYLTSSQLTTQLGQDYIVTGKIAANQIVAGTINGFTITGGTITGTTIQSSSDSSNSVVISGNSVVASYGASNIKMTSTYVSNGSTWNIPAIWMNSGNKDVGVLYSLSDSVCLSTANDGIARELDLVSTSGAVNISSSSGTNISGGDLSVFGDINFTGNLLKNGSLFTQVAVFA